MSDAASMLGGDGGTTATTTTDPAAGTAATTTAATTTATTDTAGAATTTAPTWTDVLDEDGKKFVETRGFKSPADALQALRDSAPPESPDKYDLPVPEGEDPAFAQSMAPILHKAGLSAAQAKALTEGWNELQATQRATAAQEKEAAEREHTALMDRQRADVKREWGADFDKNSEHVRRAWATGAAAAGIKPEQMQEAVDLLGGAIGFPAALKMFAFYGQHFAEDAAHGLGQKGATLTDTATRIYDKSNMNP